MTSLIIGNHTQGSGSCAASPTDDHPVMLWDRIISLSRFSRYLHGYHRVKPGTMQNIYQTASETTLLSAIERLVPEGSRWPVFTVHDDLVLFLHRHRERLCGRLLFPRNDIPGIIDKFRFSQSLKGIGIDTPETHLLSDFSPKYLDSGRQFVAKGRLGNRFRNISNCKGKIIRNLQDIKNLIAYIGSTVCHREVIVQEKIGTNEKVLSCCGLAVEGKILRSFQYVKLRQHPDQFGTGSLLQSIQRRALLEKASLITEHFAFTGIFEIEFIETADGRLSVIEMNPRTWKSIHFAALCGQNMCRLYHDFLVHGMRPQENHAYETDRGWVDIITDLPQAVRKGGLKGVRYRPGTFHCVMDAKDPLPFMAEILLIPFLALGV